MTLRPVWAENLSGLKVVVNDEETFFRQSIGPTKIAWKVEFNQNSKLVLLFGI